MTTLPPSARSLTPEDDELVEAARRTIGATTDAGPGKDGIHIMA